MKPTLFLLVVLLGGAVSGCRQRIDEQGFWSNAEKREVTLSKIQVHLKKASLRALERDLAGPKGEEQQELGQLLHTERLSRIDAVADGIVRLASGPEAKDWIPILAEEGVEESLSWLEQKRREILEASKRQQESQREFLHPLLRGAQVAGIAGEEALAERLFRDVLAADPSWVEPRVEFLSFLLHTKGPRSEIEETLTEVASVYQEAERLARQLIEESRGRTSQIANRESSGSEFAPEYHRELASVLERQGGIAEAMGSWEEAKSQYLEMLQISRQLAEELPENRDLQHKLSVSHAVLGELAIKRLKLEEANTHLERRVEILQKLTALSPSPVQWQVDLGHGYSRLGDVALLQASNPHDLKMGRPVPHGQVSDGAALLQLEGAAILYGNRLEVFQNLVTSDPGNVQWQIDLANSYECLGNVAKQRGELETASQHFQARHDKIATLAVSRPGQVDLQRDLARSHEILGNFAKLRQDPEESDRQFGANLAILRKLAASHPHKLDLQRDLAGGLMREGDRAKSRGDLDAAHRHYRARFELITQLAAADPDNSRWQRDLAVSHSKLGDLARVRRDFEEEVRQFGEAHEINRTLAAADPRNTNLQRQLALSHDKMGYVAKARGDLEEAERNLVESVEILRKLAKADPSDRSLKHHLWTSHLRLGNHYQMMSRNSEARTQFGNVLTILSKMKESGTLMYPGDERWIAVTERKLKEVGEE